MSSRESLPANEGPGHSSMSDNDTHTTAGRDRLWAGLVLAAHAPLVVLHFVNLWQFRPHYEFFPVLLVIVAGLLYARWPRSGEVVPDTLSRALSLLGLLAGLSLLALAVLLFSPWLGVIAAVCSLLGVLAALTGREVRKLLAPWALLWLVIPPPLSLDQDFVRQLQQQTSRAASAGLEYFGFRHLLDGNVFRVPSAELFVSEGCSGIHSQLVLIAASLVLAVIRHRSPLQSLFLLLSSVFWSFAVNTTRIMLIVAIFDRYQIDLSSGWKHQFFGAALVLLGFLLLLVTDFSLAGLLAPLSTDGPRTRWSFWVTGVRGSPEAKSRYASPSPAPATSRGLALAVAPAILLAGLQLAVVLRRPHPIHAPAIQQLTSTIQQDWVPTQVGPWFLERYSVEDRDVNDDFGAHSSHWQFASPDGRRVRFSVDYPFFGWHNLPFCYRMRGWTDQPHDMQPELVQVDLSRANNETAFLLFNVIDGRGLRAAFPAPRFGGWRQTLADSELVRMFRGLPAADNADQTIETVQMQLLSTTAVSTEGPEREELRSLFLALQEHVRGRLLSEQTASPAPASAELATR